MSLEGFNFPSTYRFYRSNGDCQLQSNGFPPGYTWFFWQPSLRTLWPEGSRDLSVRLRFLFRSALHYLGLFSGQGCGAFCVECNGRVVHYSAFTPRYWRFPFLEENDLQIGNIWTEPSHRGRGLAQTALGEILRIKREPGRHFWYVVDQANGPSVRVAEKTGFALAGNGIWVRPFGIKLLGSYVMDITQRAAHEAESDTTVHVSQ